ncbi:hypothetical protein BACFIN_08043 [Bacteroides finegoldii DSM 17565]|nr:hypothetical protein BACFIN_08043 [Bacteroides finegoldii DSM 17565]KAA5241470.1 hypothetical protein F2Z21_05255 [Bacteroides finegoldii]
MKKQYPRRMLCLDTTLAVSSTYTKQNERYIVSIPLFFEIGDFSCRIKAKNAFYISDHFSSQTLQR